MVAMPEILVINLARSTDRMAFMAGQLNALGLDFTRLEAADANSIDEANFARLGDTYMRPITRTEFACLTSHTRAWQRSVDTNRPVLVLEDDAFISTCLPSFLAWLSELEALDIVNIETRGKEKWVCRRPFATEPTHAVSLYALYIDRGGAAGYVIWPTAADKLLKRAELQAAPADALIDLSGVPRLQSDPGLVSPIYVGGVGGHSIEPPFRTTIALPTKASRLALSLLRPKLKMRRLAGYIAMTVRKLAATGVGNRRQVAVCPTILVHADNWSLSHG